MIRKTFRITFGIVTLIVGLFGWLIPIPLVPFFLLFFVGLHMLNLDLKLLKLLKKLGVNTEWFEKNLKRVSKKPEKETIPENQNTLDPQ